MTRYAYNNKQNIVINIYVCVEAGPIKKAENIIIIK